MFHLFVVIKFSFFFSKEIKASELLKDPEKLKHIPHQLSSPEKDKQRKCLNYIQLLIIDEFLLILSATCWNYFNTLTVLLLFFAKRLLKVEYYPNFRILSEETRV